MAKIEITADQARELLRYEPETGEFFVVKQRPGSRSTKVGQRVGSLNAGGYIQIRIFGRAYYGHRLAWLLMTGAWPTSTIDHKDLNRANNRWENLREASRSEQQANHPKHSNNSSGFKGVSWNKEKRLFEVRTSSHGRQIFGGYFDTASEGAAAYQEIMKSHFGEFARVA